jgi:WD40 repeat protein
MPISSNGVLCGALCGDFLFVGAGDGKIKKINLANGGWQLTHEALLDSKVVSVNVSSDQQELIVGTISGKMYRVLANDFSYLLHSDAHSAAINDVCFGNDSNTFVAIDEAGALKAWDLSDYKATASI